MIIFSLSARIPELIIMYNLTKKSLKISPAKFHLKVPSIWTARQGFFQSTFLFLWFVVTFQSKPSLQTIECDKHDNSSSYTSLKETL